ncbi:hypothetical protein IAT38_001389 [Cryptococcus sp. DSM 104549]
MYFALVPLLPLLVIPAMARPHARQCRHRNRTEALSLIAGPEATSSVTSTFLPSSVTTGAEPVVETTASSSESSASEEPTESATETLAPVEEQAEPTETSFEQVESVTSTVQTEETSSTEEASQTSSAAAEASETAAAASTDGGNGDEQTYLDLHNNLRAQYGAGAVTWNSTLASYAKDAAARCVFTHTGGPYGENLASGAGGGYDITDGFNSWANEAPDYSSSNPVASHFTQVVWKGTDQIGCATATCADGTLFKNIGSDSLYVVCEYYPPGNVLGTFSFNVAA